MTIRSLMRVPMHLAAGNHERLAGAFDYQYRHDALGHRLHVGAGLLMCFFAGWPTTWVEWGCAPVYVYGLIRVLNTWRVWAVFWTRPLVLLILAWASWQALTLAWSLDAGQGLDDLSPLRFVAAAWLLWPVMDRRGWLIAALAAGFLVGNAVQLGDAIGRPAGLPWLEWSRPENRHSGWWDPAVAGSLLVGALGLHLPAALMGRGRARALAIACSAATAVCLLATGTRGAWVAGAALVMLTAIVAVARGAGWGAPAPRGSVRRRGLVAAGAAIAVLGAGVVAWYAVGPGVARRVAETRREFEAAWSRGDYSTFTGQRVVMAHAAVAAIAEHPLGGVGAGGFRAWMSGRTGDPARSAPHAHNTLLHAGATSGVPGLLLTAGVMLAALGGALAREQLGPAGLGSYAAGPGFALLGLVLVSAFDTLYVNAQTGALLCLLFSMSLLPPPRTPGWTAAPTGTPPRTLSGSTRSP